MRQDFYLTVFDPREASNLRSIFYDFSRVCNLPLQELIPINLLEGIPSGKIPAQNKSCPLYNFMVQPSQFVVEDKLEVLDAGSGDVIQKKIMPWTSLLDSDEEICSHDSSPRY